MFSAAVRILARAATIQLEEAAAAHPRPPTRTLLKGKERALPIRRDIRPEPAVVESDLGVHAGTEGYGGHETALSQTGKEELGAGHGMEEHLASIVEEIPRKNESPAGPSRIPRHRPIPQPLFQQDRVSSELQSAPTGLSRQPHEELDLNTAKSAPIALDPLPQSKSTIADESKVEDSPLIQAELPVSDQLHEILNAKTDEPSLSTADPAVPPIPAVAKPVDEPVTPSQPAHSEEVSVNPSPPRTEEVESGDILPTTNESSLPVAEAEEAEDVNPIFQTRHI
jgi:hypothetical protein